MSESAGRANQDDSHQDDRHQDHAEDKAKEALVHLQRAALEMIAAARAVLDVAEELVKDPAPLVAAASAAAETAAAAARAKPQPQPGSPEEGPPPPRVEHIRVS